MRAPRGWLETPITDDDRRRAFAAATFALLLAAIALTLAADPPSRPATVTNESRATTGRADEPVPAARVPARVLSAARQFIDGYLAALRGERTMRGIPGASASLRRQLAAQPIRVSPSMRHQRARVARIDGHRFGGGWLVDADIASGGVRFPISLVVGADRAEVPVVTRLVGD